MLGTIAIILLVLWLVGIFAIPTVYGAIHILAVVGIILLAIHLIKD